MMASTAAGPNEPSPQPTGPEVQPPSPGPEVVPPRPPRPEVGPDPAQQPQEIPQPTEPDVQPPPPDMPPTPQPDVVPPAPGNPPVMAFGPALAAALLWACGGPGLHAAWAQADQAPPPGETRDVPADTPGAGSLSEELERSKGVIAPRDPGVDPGMVQPAPDTHGTTMPVIPPPGTPGGNPNVQPQ